jgi:hypothetical protein
MRCAQCCFFIILFAMALGLLAFIPKEEDPIDRLVLSLQRWVSENPQEKVYLHTDRPYYAIGDTIWFKAYVTIGSMHQLSAKSGALYVELVNEKDSVTQLLKLPVLAGMAKGSFVLDETLSEGNYRMRSYTQWMRNAGPDYFYDKVFVIQDPSEKLLYTRISYNFTEDSAGKVLTALLSYTDSAGHPYVRKKVKYNLRRSYNTVTKASGITDEKGQLKVVLRYRDIEEMKGVHLDASIELDENDVLFKTFPVKAAYSRADVQFFPEGGQLLNGFRARVAFKVTGTDGLGMPSRGVLLDMEGREIIEFETGRFGMGYFMFSPQHGKNYQAKLSYANGSTEMVKMPQAADYGYTLAAYYNTKTDVISVTVNGLLPVRTDQHEVSLILQSGGTDHFVARIPMNYSSASLQISAKDLPSGMAQLSLFSATGEPMNERVVFIQHDDQLKVDISGGKTTYKRRERVDLELDAFNPDSSAVIANFSVAVVNEDQVPAGELKENTIYSHLLLSSDIRGYIEQPNYYFHQSSAETRADLDVLMLTQGFRRFVWKDLAAGKIQSTSYPAESLITEVSGRLINLWGAKVQKGNVILANNSLNLVLATITDDQGRFKFNDLVITEGLRFSVQGRKANDGHRLEVLLDKTHVQKLTPNVNIGDMSTEIRKLVLIPSAMTKDGQFIQSDMPASRQLKEVNIKVKPIPNYMARLKGQIDQTIVFNDLDVDKTILKCLQKRDLGNVKIVQQFDQRCGPLFDGKPDGAGICIAYAGRVMMDIYVDDNIVHKCDTQDLLSMDPRDVIKVDIVRSDKMVRPSLLVYMRSKFVKGDWTPWMVNIFPRGFDRVKEFYEPEYLHAEIPEKLTDLRTTLYWNPSVIVKRGVADFSFYNGDRKGNYRVVVEGISSDGLLGRQVYRYRVE